MARSFDAEVAAETALPSPARRMSQVRRAGGGLSLGGAVVAGHHGSVQCRGPAGQRVELARNGASLWVELEKRGYSGEASRAIRIKASGAAARACDRDRRSEPAQRPGLSDG